MAFRVKFWFLTFKSTILALFDIAQSYFVSKESTDVTDTRETLWSDKLYMLALLRKIVYKYRGNNTYVIQEKTALALPHCVNLQNTAFSFKPIHVFDRIKKKTLISTPIP